VNSADLDPKKIFEPADIGQMFLGWLLHAYKGRHRHDLAARRCDYTRLWLGSPAAVFSAIVGTSVFAALGNEAPSGIKYKLAVAAISIVSAILTGLSTFLNLSERAEKHRSAGVRYKEVIRELERVLAVGLTGLTQADPSLVVGIQKRLDDLEDSAPIVPERIYDRVEREWHKHGAAFIEKAAEIYQSKG
jgi:hypothetical protein